MKTEVIKEIQDLTYLSWEKIRNSSGTAGSFLKAYSDLGTEKIYYKLSDYDAYKGIVGHECFNEIIADRLLSILGIDHLHYKLIHADIVVDNKKHTTFLCASTDFKKKNENKIALGAYYQAERLENESPMDFCVRNGWEEYIYQMLVVDFLILNRDRHGANMEVLRNSKERTIRLAPLFDHGLSFMFQCVNLDEMECVNVMEDRPVQCFVGSRSTAENLKLIPKDRLMHLTPLREENRGFLFGDLGDIMPKVWQEKIWEMLCKRWKYYESFCGQR